MAVAIVKVSGVLSASSVACCVSLNLWAWNVTTMPLCVSVATQPPCMFLDGWITNLLVFSIFVGYDDVLFCVVVEDMCVVEVVAAVDIELAIDLVVVSVGGVA